MVDVNAPDIPSHGNDDVVDFLERWLNEAKLGKISNVALAVVEAPDKMYADSAGSILHQTEMHIALEELRRKVDEACEARIAPYDPSSPPNQVCYNLASGIVSFDFLPWMIGAEMWRIRKGGEPPLKVAFYRNSHSRFLDYHYQMLQNVFGPITEMVGAVTNDVLGGFGGFPPSYVAISKACRDGEKVPQISALPERVEFVERNFDKRPVTITLREASHYPHRNSNVPEWLKVAKYLRGKGEEVIFVRDTAKAEEELSGETIFPLASTDLHIRLALYKHAKANLFVGNGPATLAWHTSVPFLQMNEIDPRHVKRYQPGWPEWWPRAMGITAGTQFPWFNENQRIVWTPDTFDHIVMAYDALTF